MLADLPRPPVPYDLSAEKRYRGRMANTGQSPEADHEPSRVDHPTVYQRVSKRVQEDWPGYCERLMTREEMMVALRECDHQ